MRLFALLFASLPLLAGDPLRLAPGMPVDEAVEALGEGGAWQGRQYVVPVDALAGIMEPQRVVLTLDGSGRRLAAVHVQIEVSRGGGDDDLMRLADRVRRTLLDRLGGPAWERWGGRHDRFGDEEGLAMEWRLAHGVVRAGVPERLDGRRIVEIAITARAFPIRERFWGASSASAAGLPGD